MNREKWLKERGKGIGGSDAAAILGLNPYKSNTDLWREKIGLYVPPDISDKPYIKYGNDAEPLLTELFALDYPQYEVKGYEYNTFINKDYPFIIGSLDGLLIDKKTGEKGILEIKTSEILRSMQKEKWKDKIPDNYFIQCLHYMLVTDATFCILKAQLKTKFEGEVYLQTKHYHFTREEVKEDLEFLLNKEIEFWNKYVLTKKEPPLVLNI